VTGVRLSEGWAQQAGVAQLLWSALQQWQVGGEVEVSLARNAPFGQPATIEKKSASNMDRLFWNAARIIVPYS